MRWVRGVRVALALAGLCACVSAQGAAAPEESAYPTKPVRLIVPFAPGGSSTIVARSVALEMEKGLGQPIVIDYISTIAPTEGGSTASRSACGNASNNSQLGIETTRA